jgi:L-fuculose-phosphate aldolase
VAFMVNHGVLIIGNDVSAAYFRAAVIEWRCRQAWHVEALGSGVPMADATSIEFGERINKSVANGNFDNWFAAAARRIIRHDTSVLD